MITVDLQLISFFPGLQVLQAVMQKIGGIGLLMMMSVDQAYFSCFCWNFSKNEFFRILLETYGEYRPNMNFFLSGHTSVAAHN